MTNTRTRLLAVLATAAGGLAGAIIAAPTANADQYDFIGQLDSAGVTYTNLTDMITVGKDVCHELRIGDSPAHVLSDLAPGGWSAQERGIIVSAAAHTMCPDTLPAINAAINGNQTQLHPLL